MASSHVQSRKYHVFNEMAEWNTAYKLNWDQTAKLYIKVLKLR